MELHDLPLPNNGPCFESLDYTPPYDYRAIHRHSYFEIILIKKGGGVQIIDFESSPIEDYSIYLIFPDQVHLLKKELQAEGRVLQFHGDFLLNQSSSNLNLSLGRKLSITNKKEQFDILWDIYSSMQKEARLGSEKSLQIQYHYLNIFLLKLATFSDSQEKPKEDQNSKLLRDFSGLLNQKFESIQSVTEYADLLSTTPRKLNSLCKKHLGKTPLKIIHDRLLLESKRLLLLKEHSIKEIAFQLNFDSPASFSNFIKDKSGLNPTQLQEYLVKIHKEMD